MSPTLMPMGILPELMPRAPTRSTRHQITGNSAELRGEVLSAIRRGRILRCELYDERVSPNHYETQVEMQGGGGDVALKVSYHPYWTAEIDGSPALVRHVIPNFMAVTVPAGSHRIRFSFEQPAYQLALLLGTLIVLFGLAASTIRRRRRRQRSR